MQGTKNQPGIRKEETKVWHSNELGQIECLRANYVTHSFARHTHDGFAIGVVERGIELFNYRGKKNRAGNGQVILINPGEVHDGQGAGTDGWAFSIFYVDPKVLKRAAMEITGNASSIPFFKDAVVDDRISSGKLLRLHRTLENSSSLLERESSILATFAELISRQSSLRPISASMGREPRAILRAKTYIEENYTENFSLTELASFAHLSRFHLIRVFRRHTGLTPHAYLEQIRINRAKDLLKSGSPIADAAYELGFVDQSHLTKTFKKFAGTTPGQYEKDFRPSS